MEQFKVSQEGYNKLIKKWLIIMIAVLGVVLSIYIATAIISHKPGEFDPSPIVIPVVAVIVGFSVFRGIRKQRRIFLSYCVTITDSDITREQINIRPLSINFMEVREIIKTKKGGFMIKGRSSTDVIHIPYVIDNPASLEERLKTFAPITVWEKDPWHLKYRWVISLLAVGVWVATFTVENKPVSVICGLSAIALILWAFIFILRSKNVPVSTKRRSWIYLLLILGIIYFLYIRLGGKGIIFF